MAARQRSDGTTAGGEAVNGTSIFDPTLAELIVRWFSPPGGTILDPFAGGSVRGIVAAKLGRPYVGVELRAEQVAANEVQAEVILADMPDDMVRWVVGDSREVLPGLCADKSMDFIYTCPPYADLEVYSDDPKDISTYPWPRFSEALRDILQAAALKLKDDRFFVIVIGDVRDKRTGNYYGLPARVVLMMQSMGLHLYNDIVLMTPAGSLPGRTKQAFVASRKVGRTHQSVLVFVRGDAKKATEACGECQFGEGDPLADMAEEGQGFDPDNPLEGLGVPL